MLAAPSIGSQGWVTEPADYVDRLFAYYTATNYHQTLYFKGQVHSLIVVPTWSHLPQRCRLISSLSTTAPFQRARV